MIIQIKPDASRATPEGLKTMIINMHRKIMPLGVAILLLLTTVCKPVYEPTSKPLSSELAPGAFIPRLAYCNIDAITEAKKKLISSNSVEPTFGPHRTSKSIMLNNSIMLNRMKEVLTRPPDLSNGVFHMTNCSGKICITPIRVDSRSN